MKSLLLAVLFSCLAIGAAWAQPQQPAQGKPPACISQYSEAAAMSPGLLISTGFDIKAAIPGGIWL